MSPNNNREDLLDTWLALTGDAPPKHSPLRLPVLTGSMRPLIPVGAILHIEKFSADGCHPGDVVVYRDGDRLVAHRILLRLGRAPSLLFYEKGDANDGGHWLSGQKILGLVRAVEPRPETPAIPLMRDPAAARSSLRADLVHRILAWPRRLKSILTGHEP